MHKYIIAIIVCSSFFLVGVGSLLVMAADTPAGKPAPGITQDQANEAFTRLNYIGTREAEILAEIGKLEQEKARLTQIVRLYQAQEAKKVKQEDKGKKQ